MVIAFFYFNKTSVFAGSPFRGRRGRLYGTGSYPCPPQGWHLLIRFAVSHNPFMGPYFFNASMPYCEQVGV